MVLTEESTQALPPGVRRRRRRRWAILSIVLVLLVAGSVSGVTVARHYADAPPLECACGLGWGAPDNLHERTSHVGPWSAMSVPARPGAQQSFYVLIRNPASVTQTFLGYPYATRDTAEPLDLEIARPSGSSSADQGDWRDKHFTTGRVDLPPGAIRWLRLTIHTGHASRFAAGSSEDWTDLPVRVRVGAFTRIETIDFDRTSMELRHG